MCLPRARQAGIPGRFHFPLQPGSASHSSSLLLWSPRRRPAARLGAQTCRAPQPPSSPADLPSSGAPSPPTPPRASCSYLTVPSSPFAFAPAPSAGKATHVLPCTNCSVQSGPLPQCSCLPTLIVGMGSCSPPQPLPGQCSAQPRRDDGPWGSRGWTAGWRGNLSPLGL